MSSTKRVPHFSDQHFADGNDSVGLPPSNGWARNVTNDSSGQKSTDLTSLPRRPRGRRATKDQSVARGRSGEKTCTAEKKPSNEKDGFTDKSPTSGKYYVVLAKPLAETLLLDDDSCDDEERPATGKCFSAKKHQSETQLSGERHRFSEKSRSFKKHLSDEKDSPIQRGYLIKKRRLTEKVRSTEEDGLAERGPYGERVCPFERGQPRKKGLSTKKSPSPEKGYLDGSGPSTEKQHPQEKDSPAKKLSCTERYLQIAVDYSVKRGLSTEKDHPVRRGPSAKKSHLAEKEYSASKSRSAGRDRNIKSRCAEERHSVDLVNWASSRHLAGEDSSTRRDRRLQSCPIVEGRSLDRGKTAKKRPSTAKDHPTGRSQLEKKKRHAEEGRSADLVNRASSTHLAGEDSPTWRDGCIQSCPIVEGRSLDRSKTTKKRPSTVKDHPAGRSRPEKKKRRAEERHSADLVNRAWSRYLAGEDSPTWRDRRIQSCPTVEGLSLDRGKTAKKRPSTAKDHPTGRSQPEKKKHRAKEGRSADLVNRASSRHLAGEDSPIWRGRRIQSLPAEEGRLARSISLASSRPCGSEEDIHTGRGGIFKTPLPEDSRLLEWCYTVERRPSTGKDHPTGRSWPEKKSRPGEEGCSAERVNLARSGSVPFAVEDIPTERGGRIRSRPAEEGYLLKRGYTVEKTPSTAKDHPTWRSPPRKKSRSAEEGQSADRGTSARQILPTGRDRYNDKESNTGENVCSVEEGHHSMEQGFHVEEPSSGSMPTVPVLVPEHMENTPENRIGSGTSQVAQVPHQNVVGVVTTGRRMQAANLRMGVDLKLPRVLKACLAEDWDLINKQRQLFHLPAEKNVDRILKVYATLVKSQKKSGNTEYSIDELVYRIRKSFNKMLGTHLLFQFEKLQYAEILLAYPDIPMSQIYGAPHLLRLFVNIGTALAHSYLNRHSPLLVSSYMHGFLNYLAENSTSLFNTNNYKMASVAYCFKAL
ncbi:hypothetical protein NN561_012068 [Cricetulus griseus]